MSLPRQYSYNRRKDRMVKRDYSNQVMRSKKKGKPLPTYTRDELIEWCYSQPLFHRMYDNWKRLDFQTDYKPSIDRINSDLWYTIDNIQLLTWKENNIKGRKETSKKLSKGIIQRDKKGNIIAEFNSSKEASETLGIRNECIYALCNNEYILEYKG